MAFGRRGSFRKRWPSPSRDKSPENALDGTGETGSEELADPAEEEILGFDVNNERSNSKNRSDDLQDDRPFARKSARNKIMDLLARRGYSELELQQKLSLDYPEDEVQDAIENARESGWMTPPDELASRVAIELGRKNKGHRFIQQFLKAKGLPQVQKDPDEEVRKGLELVEAKLKKAPPYAYEDQKKIYRWLGNRGFDMETIRRVIDYRPDDHS